MSIHDIRKLKRASLTPKPAIIDGFMDSSNQVGTKLVEKTTIPKLNLNALREPSSTKKKSCA